MMRNIKKVIINYLIPFFYLVYAFVNSEHMLKERVKNYILLTIINFIIV